MKLWLDDIRPAPEGWIWAKTAWQGLRDVINYGYDVEEWNLDHDLGDGPTGYNFLLTIIELKESGLNLRLPERLSLHSANPVGVANMRAMWDSYLKRRLPRL